VNVDPSAIVWPGILPTTGASLSGVTVNVARSLSDFPPGSVAVNVMVSEPFQSAFGTLIVATLDTMETVSALLPELVHVICVFALSTSET